MKTSSVGAPLILSALLLSALPLQAGAETHWPIPADRGEATFDLWCNGCHMRESEPYKIRIPATTILRERYKGSKPASLLDRTDLTAEYIKFVARNGLNSMPPFRKTEVSDADLSAVIQFLTRNNPKP